MFTPEQKAKFSNPNVPVYMTVDEGESLATAGLIQADPAQKDPSNDNAFLVTLTAAGQQALATPAQPPAAPTAAVPPAAPAAPAVPPAAPATPPAAPATAEAPVTTGVGYDASQTDNIGAVRADVGLPAPKPRGGKTGGTRKSQYPYDQLPEQVPGQQPASFHVKAEEGKTVADLVKKMSSNTSAANRRYEEADLDANGQTQQEVYDKRTFTRDAEGGYVLDENGKRTSTVEQKSRIKMKRTRKFISAEVSDQDPEGPGVRVFRVALS